MEKIFQTNFHPHVNYHMEDEWGMENGGMKELEWDIGSRLLKICVRYTAIHFTVFVDYVY